MMNQTEAALDPIALPDPIAAQSDELRTKPRYNFAASKRCTAHNRAGEVCKNPAMAGGTVCRNHGGAAPQVRAKAQERLLMAAIPAVATLHRALAGRKTELPSAVKAAGMILDRVLGVPGQTLTMQGDAAGGPVRVVHVYAQLPGSSLPALPAVEAAEAEVVEAPEAVAAVKRIVL